MLNKNIKLPGLGSYMATAVEHGDTPRGRLRDHRHDRDDCSHRSTRLAAARCLGGKNSSSSRRNPPIRRAPGCWTSCRVRCCCAGSRSISGHRWNTSSTGFSPPRRSSPKRSGNARRQRSEPSSAGWGWLTVGGGQRVAALGPARAGPRDPAGDCSRRDAARLRAGPVNPLAGISDDGFLPPSSGRRSACGSGPNRRWPAWRNRWRRSRLRSPST